RPMRLALEAVDPKLHEAMAVVGLGPWRRLWVIDLPLALPGIIAGLVLGFAKGLGEFGATITFVASIPGETRTLSLAIYSALQGPNTEQLVFILSAISIGISLAAVFASEIMVEKIGKKLGNRRTDFA
ncbi:MAG: ABC transporter permease subunit, partial [Devosiaceae bacterium]|nr:ABC transporter permease subunit [Devosiaceae bacterium]